MAELALLLDGLANAFDRQITFSQDSTEGSCSLRDAVCLAAVDLDGDVTSSGYKEDPRYRSGDVEPDAAGGETGRQEGPRYPQVNVLLGAGGVTTGILGHLSFPPGNVPLPAAGVTPALQEDPRFPSVRHHSDADEGTQLNKIEPNINADEFRPAGTRGVHGTKQTRGPPSVVAAIAFYLGDLDPGFDSDLTNEVYDGQRRYFRGGEVYNRPYGWKGYGVKVIGKYDSNVWLGPFGASGSRTESAGGEWPVSFSGTSRDDIQSIARKGYRPLTGPLAETFGCHCHILSTPNLESAEKMASPFEHKEGKYIMVFQNRVNPQNLVKKQSKDNRIGEVWLNPCNPGGENVRLYRILIREVNTPQNPQYPQVNYRQPF